LFRRITSGIIILLVTLNLGLMATVDAQSKNKKSPVKQEKVKSKKQAANSAKDEAKPVVNQEELKAFEDKCSMVDPLELVNEPDKFLDKNIMIQGQFDKYTTLGLDYKPVGKPAKDFITFLIRRPDVKRKNTVIPLSELKLILSRKTAETYTSLETGDNLKIYGKVISSALGDPWVEVDHIVSTTKDLTAIPKDQQKNVETEDNDE